MGPHEGEDLDLMTPSRSVRSMKSRRGRLFKKYTRKERLIKDLGTTWPWFRMDNVYSCILMYIQSISKQKHDDLIQWIEGNFCFMIAEF